TSTSSPTPTRTSTPTATRTSTPTATSTRCAYVSAVLSTAPVGFCPLTLHDALPILDSSGNGHTGTQSGGVTSVAGAILSDSANTALSFDVSTAVAFASSARGAGSAARSIEVWVRTDAWSASVNHFFSSGSLELAYVP